MVNQNQCAEGTLYIVATPIGNIGDITYRAVEILKAVDMIAAEDTRHSQTLLQHYGINAKMLALHEHNERRDVDKVISLIQQGKHIALISDAGTPLISDPGFILVREAHRRGISVMPIPGACAAIAAMSVSGLPTDRFIFEGFLPSKQSARCRYLATFTRETRSIIFYESTHRIIATLNDMIAVFGADRIVTLAKELTKQFEMIKTSDLSELVEWLSEDVQRQKGEFVLVVQGFGKIDSDVQEENVHKVLSVLLDELPVKQAVRLAAALTGQSKNALYPLAVSMGHAKGEGID